MGNIPCLPLTNSWSTSTADRYPFDKSTAPAASATLEAITFATRCGTNLVWSSWQICHTIVVVVSNCRPKRSGAALESPESVVAEQTSRRRSLEGSRKDLEAVDPFLELCRTESYHMISRTTHWQRASHVLQINKA